jgi:hypothetical protein
MARVLPATVQIPLVSKELVSSVQSHQITLKTIGQEANGETGENCDIAALAGFLSHHRININVRQVLPDGIDTIDDIR